MCVNSLSIVTSAERCYTSKYLANVRVQAYCYVSTTACSALVFLNTTTFKMENDFMHFVNISKS